MTDTFPGLLYKINARYFLKKGSETLSCQAIQPGRLILVFTENQFKIEILKAGFRMVWLSGKVGDVK